MEAADCKPGTFIMHVTGGPVQVVKFETSMGEIHCERWNGKAFVQENFTPETIRPATQAEIDALGK